MNDARLPENGLTGENDGIGKFPAHRLDQGRSRGHHIRPHFHPGRGRKTEAPGQGNVLIEIPAGGLLQLPDLVGPLEGGHIDLPHRDEDELLVEAAEAAEDR